MIYSLFVIGWLMEKLWTRSIWRQFFRYLDIGDLTWLPNPFRDLTRLPIYPIHHTLTVWLRFVMIIYILFMLLHFVIVLVDTLVWTLCISLLCDGTLGGPFSSSIISFILPVSSNTWSALGRLDTSYIGNACPLPLLLLSVYYSAWLSVKQSCRSELASSVVDAPFWWVILFIFQLCGHLHTLLQFMLLIPKS